MRQKKGGLAALVLSVIFLFGLAVVLESTAWARAGGGRSSGSRGSRSFSSPSMPSRPSPSPSPGVTPRPSQPSPGFGAPSSPGMARSPSPFWSGLAGGVAGGLLGNMLFGSRGYAGTGGGFGGSGIGLFDLIIIGAMIYFGYRLFFRRRREPEPVYYEESRTEPLPQYGGGTPYYGSGSQPYTQEPSEVDRGMEEIARFDPSFNPESFKETVEDMFFRIQAGWMNRSLDGLHNLLTPEMSDYFDTEFARMKQQGIVNRLENIAVRKVEPSEVWQESGKDFITVLFTANLLDYTVDDRSGQVIAGDKLNPVKFQEFWTFSRDIGSRQWQLSGINQLGEPATH